MVRKRWSDVTSINYKNQHQNRLIKEEHQSHKKESSLITIIINASVVKPEWYVVSEWALRNIQLHTDKQSQWLVTQFVKNKVIATGQFKLNKQEWTIQEAICSKNDSFTLSEQWFTTDHINLYNQEN